MKLYVFGDALSHGASSLPNALCVFLLNHTLGIIRKEHFLFSIFQAPPDELIKFTRVQRVVCLAAVLVTSLAVVAFLYGQQPLNVEDRVVTTILAAFFMFPCRVMLPVIFRKANTLPALPRWPHLRLPNAVLTAVLKQRRGSNGDRSASAAGRESDNQGNSSAVVHSFSTAQYDRVTRVTHLKASHLHESVPCFSFFVTVV